MASSGNFALLASDFQALASETKRKHADIKEASDKALVLIKTSPDQVLSSLRMTGIPIPSPADDIFRPISMACVTKNSKVVVIALGALQRLIGMDAVPPSKIPLIVNLLSTVLPLGVEIQLRILQTLPSLFTRCSQYLRGNLLAEALLLCFRLQDSRIGVVSSTAAATLRQLVMVVFEGVAAEDKAVQLAPGSTGSHLAEPETDFVVSIPPFESLHLSGATERMEARQVALRPSSKDAYLVFEDLCLLVNGDSPSFLKLQSLPKTFGLELIESVMTGHGNLFQQHPELIFVLRSQLCPLLIRALSEKPNFPLTLRLMRVAFLLLKQFSDDLLVEAEIFLSLIIKTISVDHSEGQAEPVPTWLRVLALEIFRGLCVDFDLLLKIYERYDMRHPDQSSGLFTSMMSTFNRLASEKPALLGINHDITTGSSSSYQAGSPANPGVQGMIDGVVGIATQAAAPLVGTQSGGLSLSTAAIKLQCIDQLDKAEAPVIPETYVYLLALQCICNVAEGFAGFTLAQHDQFRPSRPENPPDSTPPPSFIIPLDNLEAGPMRERLKITQNMADASWPALLASLNFFVSTNLDDDLFNETLSAMQSFTYVCGVLDLATPRDAFLLSFCKFAVPSAILNNLIMEASGAAPPKSSQNVLGVDSLGLTASHSPTYFSPRSLAFLRTLLSVAHYLAGILGSSWFTVFETLQNADYVLAAKLKKRGTLPSSLTSTTSGNTSDEGAMQASIHKLFDCSRALDSKAFTCFVIALCRLSSVTIGLPTHDTGGAPASTPNPLAHETRRKVSASNSFRNLRQNERSFALAKLGSVALLNVRRLVLPNKEIAWTPITSHLLAALRYAEAPSNVRLQAADVLDRVILSTAKLINSLDEDLQFRAQTQVIEVLGRQTEPDSLTQTSTDIEVRKLGFETLFKILEHNGHSYVAGWKLIFDVLRTACEPAAPQVPLNSESMSTSRGTSKPSSHITSKVSVLVRNSFPSLQLICTDFLTALKLEELRQCISVLAEFGRQTEDINIALTSGGLLWQVSDHVQVKNTASKEGDESYVRLWMFLLSKLLELVHASRQEVRDGAIQTLFRTIGLYGSSLSSSIWHELLWEVIFPLLELLSNSIKQAPSYAPFLEDNPPVDATRQPNGAPISLNAKQLDDSKILALESTGKVIFDHFSSHIVVMSHFSETWAALIQHFCHSFTCDRPSVSTASMKALATILNTNVSGDRYIETIRAACEVAWSAFVEMSDAIATSSSGLNSEDMYYTQAALEAFIQVAHPLQNASRLKMDHERVKKLLQICEVVITYSKSPDYRPDVDSMPPVSSAVVATIDNIDLNATGVPSAVLSSTSQLATLAFTSPFDVADPFSSRPSSIQVTYISLFKAIQPRLISLIEKFHDKSEIYNEGAVTKALSSLSIPLRVKYGCPASCKHGSALPLWKMATISFLNIIKRCLPALETLGSTVSQSAFEGFWKQVVENFDCALSADCNPELLLDLDQQQAEENFDLALIASLELDVLPCLGQPRVPIEIIHTLGKTVQSASRLYDLDVELKKVRHPTTEIQEDLKPYFASSENNRFMNDFFQQSKSNICGTTAGVLRRPRERFTYWCFDLLFVFCSPTNSGKSHENECKRVASIWLPILLTRCIAAIKAYTADAPIRATVPFDRLREEEIMYILRQLLTHSLCNGCLAPSLLGDYSLETPKLDASWPREKILKFVLAQPADAHLLCLQPLLIDLLAYASSTHLDGAKHVYFNSHDHSSLAAQTIPYRDLLQLETQDGSDVKGCWQGLKLGRIGRTTPDEQSSIFNKDLKQLVILCLRKISEQTTLKLELQSTD